MPQRRRISGSRSGSEVSMPQTVMLPAVGCSSPFMCRARVDFPQPLRPRIAVKLPLSMAKFSPFSCGSPLLLYENVRSFAIMHSITFVMVQLSCQNKTVCRRKGTWGRFACVPIQGHWELSPVSRAAGVKNKRILCRKDCFWYQFRIYTATKDSRNHPIPALCLLFCCSSFGIMPFQVHSFLRILLRLHLQAGTPGDCRRCPCF